MPGCFTLILARLLQLRLFPFCSDQALSRGVCSMVLVNEGEFKIAAPNEDLAHVGINSCVSITVTYANGQRIGGHASVAPGQGQQGLQGVLMGMTLLGVLSNSLHPQRVYVIGDLGSWPGRPGWPANGAAGIPAALGLNVPCTA